MIESKTQIEGLLLDTAAADAIGLPRVGLTPKKALLSAHGGDHEDEIFEKQLASQLKKWCLAFPLGAGMETLKACGKSFWWESHLKNQVCMKRALGQHKAPFGDIEFIKSTATFDAVKNQLTIRQASIATHAGRSIFMGDDPIGIIIRKAIFRKGLKLSDTQYPYWAGTKLWGRRSMEIGITFGIGKTVEWMTRDPFKDLDLNFTTPQKKEKE